MQTVILAGGESSRFWPLNQKNKSLIKIMGRPLIYYTIDSLEKAGLRNLIIIQGPEKDVEKELRGHQFSKLKIKYILQKKAKGMGNALYQARNLLKEPFFVLNAERIDGGEIVKKLKIKSMPRTETKFLVRGQNSPYQNKFGAEQVKVKAVLVGQKTEKPELYGIMKLKGDRVLGIVEKPKKGKEPSKIRIVGVYLLSPDFFTAYQKVKKGLYDFEDALSLYVKRNDVRVVAIEKIASPLKYPWHLFEIEKYLFDKFLRKKIEKNIQIAKNVTVEGKVYIGNHTKIFEGAVIKGPCYIGNNCTLGNNVLIRGYTNLEDNVLIGAGAEIKNSILQDDCRTHLGFFGDSIFDKGCTIGAGTVTANRRIDRQNVKTKIKGEKISTGLSSLGAIIGQNTKIGINVSLMPGVLIGSNCIVGPHSLAMENIRDNTTFFTLFKSVKKGRKGSGKLGCV